MSGNIKRSKKDKAGRVRYRAEGRASVNKDKRAERENKKVEFFVIRNEIMAKYKLTKGDAKRAAKLVNKGEDEDKAVMKIKSGDTPTKEKVSIQL